MSYHPYLQKNAGSWSKRRFSSKSKSRVSHCWGSNPGRSFRNAVVLTVAAGRAPVALAVAQKNKTSAPSETVGCAGCVQAVENLYTQGYGICLQGLLYGRAWTARELAWLRSNSLSAFFSWTLLPTLSAFFGPFCSSFFAAQIGSQERLVCLRPQTTGPDLTIFSHWNLCTIRARYRWIVRYISCLIGSPAWIFCMYIYIHIYFVRMLKSHWHMFVHSACGFFWQKLIHKVNSRW